MQERAEIYAIVQAAKERERLCPATDYRLWTHRWDRIPNSTENEDSDSYQNAPDPSQTKPSITDNRYELKEFFTDKWTLE